MNEFDKFRGLKFDTPADLRAWIGTVRHLSDREKARATRIADQWETELGQAQVAWLNTRSSQIAEEHGRVRAAVVEAQRETVEVERLITTGRLSAAEGRKRLTRLSRQRLEALRVQETLRRAIEAWEADAEKPPTDRLREQQQRFAVGVPMYGRRTLTVADLEGN